MVLNIEIIKTISFSPMINTISFKNKYVHRSHEHNSLFPMKNTLQVLEYILFIEIMKTIYISPIINTIPFQKYTLYTKIMKTLSFPTWLIPYWFRKISKSINILFFFAWPKRCHKRTLCVVTQHTFNLFL